MMDEFEALITSFGEHLVGTIGKNRLAELQVTGHPDSGTAEVLVRLEKNTWPEQLHAIEGIGDIRMMFMNELALSYRFLGETESISDTEQSKESTAAYSMV